MSLKKAYFYLFYKFYKFFENPPNPWGSAWKAGALVGILELIIIYTFFVYYMLFFNRHYLPRASSPESLTSAIIILCVNYFSFTPDKKWKTYAREFDKWPEWKNFKGGIIVLIIVVAIVGNLILSYYLMSLIDWKKYN
ncbi:hypothetical protein SAMN05428975_4695 [Mucilaginibacter sp. OK268]|uniref:hypothetical protein n=1 Tax=Mucilaginibacter sp. OK268 TaxID=1881048 RepID=UPI00088FC3A8|nr:hypothetical protein [Mucilaginibacter sp. OK268]SDP98294.1 hypothetical protein SAMN05428975_4695 [Mucilaginibacter sp. OK268]